MNVFKKRRALVPRDRVTSVVGRISPATFTRVAVVVANVEVPVAKRVLVVSPPVLEATVKKRLVVDAVVAKRLVAVALVARRFVVLARVE